MGIVGAVLMLTACGEYHTSRNGLIDGFWQLTDMDTLSNGHSGDVRATMIFWAVQADLLEIRDLREHGHLHVFFRFEHKNGQLTLSDPVVDRRLVSDSVVTDVHTLQPYGLSHLTETLLVLELNDEHMTLQSEQYRMYFRRY